ncbi:MAG: Cna B-type domain-containing protein [Oscillospiraceae bacterium]|nr:Cna B-type domain-containing protein [Oscillospiraceae bacterium]
MKKIKKILSLFLAFIIVFCSSPAVFAAAGNIETEKDSSLEIIFRHDEKAIPEAEFSVYLVANIDERGKYTVTEEFKDFNVNITGKNDEAWRALVSTLEGHVFKNKIEPAAFGKTDSEGVLKLTGLKPGLYLVIGTPVSFEDFTYLPESAIIQIPTLDSENNVWDYDISIKPKYSFIPDIGPDGFIERKVLKIWDDEGYVPLRPKEIKVYLFCDGEVYDTVILNEENNWRHTWSKLEDGHSWTVSEEVPDRYTLTIEKKGITFVLTNSFDENTPPPDDPDDPKPPEPPKPEPPEPDEPNLPQTGQLWWPVPVLSALGILFVAAGMIRRRGSHEN